MLCDCSSLTEDGGEGKKRREEEKRSKMETENKVRHRRELMKERKISCVAGDKQSDQITLCFMKNALDSNADLMITRRHFACFLLLFFLGKLLWKKLFTH